MNAGLTLKSLPCLLALLSSTTDAASYTNRAVSRFYYEIDEAITGFDLKLHWHFNDRNKRDFVFFCYLTNEDQSEYYYSYSQEYHLGTYAGVYSSDHAIPKSYLTGSEYHLMFGVQSTTNVNWSDYVYHDGPIGSRLLQTITKNSPKIATGRAWTYSTVYGEVDLPTYYGIVNDGSADLERYTLGIEKWNIRFYDDENPSKEIAASAELKIMTHADAFQIGTMRLQGGKIYRFIPLKLVKSPTMSGYYQVRTKKTYYYDMNLGREVEQMEEDYDVRYFETNLVIIDSQLDTFSDVTYEIALTSVNAHDTFYIRGRKSKKGIHFGNCADADYCVVIGDP